MVAPATTRALTMTPHISNQDKATTAPTLSIVIPSWNTKELTRACLASILKHQSDLPIEVIVVDNGSQDGSPEMIASEFPEVVLIRNRNNEYYSRANNQGAAVANGKYLCLLNSDTVINEGSLSVLVAFLESHPDYGAAAPRLDNPDGSVQPICRRFPTLLDIANDHFDLSWLPFARRHQERSAMLDFDHVSDRDVEQPPGTCIVMATSTFRQIGGFNEELPLFYSDVELCRAVWALGKRIRFLSNARIFHVGSASVTRHPLWRNEFVRDQVRYMLITRGRPAAIAAKFIVGASIVLTAVKTALGRASLKDKRRALEALGRTWRLVYHV